MSTVQQIITNVRDALNDTKVGDYRWEDDVLIRRLNEGLTDIATETLAFKNQGVARLRPGTSKYQLPESSIQLKAIVYRGKELPLLTTDELNKRHPQWHSATTDKHISCAVIDQQELGFFRVYPVPSLTFETTFDAETDLYGLADVVDSDESATSNLGVYGSTETDCEVFGTVTSFVDTPILACADANDLVYPTYYSIPTHVTALTDKLPMSATYDSALKYFITGTTLRNDLAAGNRALGNEELRLYSAKLTRLLARAQMESVSSGSTNTTYNGMG